MKWAKSGVTQALVLEWLQDVKIGSDDETFVRLCVLLRLKNNGTVNSAVDVLVAKNSPHKSKRVALNSNYCPTDNSPEIAYTGELADALKSAMAALIDKHVAKVPRMSPRSRTQVDRYGSEVEPAAKGGRFKSGGKRKRGGSQHDDPPSKRENLQLEQMMQQVLTQLKEHLQTPATQVVPHFRALPNEQPLQNLDSAVLAAFEKGYTRGAENKTVAQNSQQMYYKSPAPDPPYQISGPPQQYHIPGPPQQLFRHAYQQGLAPYQPAPVFQPPPAFYNPYGPYYYQ